MIWSRKKHEVETDLLTVNHRKKTTSALNLYFFLISTRGQHFFFFIDWVMVRVASFKSF